jgi:hypothetical protein
MQERSHNKGVNAEGFCNGPHNLAKDRDTADGKQVWKCVNCPKEVTVDPKLIQKQLET